MRIIDLFALQIFAKNLDRCKFRLLQHYLPMSDIAVLIRILRWRVGTAQEHHCVFDRRSVVVIALRGSRDHISGDLQTRDRWVSQSPIMRKIMPPVL
jgi:hypothetical protein